MSDVPPPPPPGGGAGPAGPAPTPPQPSPAYQPPPAAGSPSGGGASNGMAVAALVLGILTFICLGPIAGVLAIIFGIVGLGKAKETGNGRGMSIAGIVLGAVGSIVSVLVIVILIVAAGETADQIAEDIGGVADPDIYDLETGACEVDEFGFASFSGTITNTSGDEKNFTINGEFRNADSDALIDTSADIVTDLPAGDKAEWSMTVSTNDATDVTCGIVNVENFFN